MNGVFINYRTGDGETSAHAIDQRLTAVLGDERVFRDQRALVPGVEYEKKLWDTLHKCSVFLALVGPGWLTARDSNGGLKLHNEDDFVRREIAAALGQTATRVIPVLLGATVPPPRPEQLPADIKGLAGRQFMYLRPALEHLDLPQIEAEVRKYIPARSTGRAKGNKGKQWKGGHRGRSYEGRGAGAEISLDGVEHSAIGISFGDNPGPVTNGQDRKNGRRR